MLSLFPEFSPQVLTDLEAGFKRKEVRSTAYWRKKQLVTPVWVDRKAIAELYAKCKYMRSRGFDVVVDHIVPLNHPLVQGLHCIENLQIISYQANEHKSNHYWPDMPCENLDLFGIQEVEQYKLI